MTSTHQPDLTKSILQHARNLLSRWFTFPCHETLGLPAGQAGEATNSTVRSGVVGPFLTQPASDDLSAKYSLPAGATDCQVKPVRLGNPFPNGLWLLALLVTPALLALEAYAH